MINDERGGFNMSEIISSQDFKAKVLEADKPVLVDFFATWCGPCKRLSPVLEEIAQEVSGKAYVYKVDIDQSPDLAASYRVNSVPTLILFDKGTIKNKVLGAMPKQQIMSMFV